LGAGELAKDAAELVDRSEEIVHPPESRFVENDGAAHDLGDARATDLASGERDVRVEGDANPGSEEARERHRDDGEQEVDRGDRREAAGAEANVRRGARQRNGDLRLAIIAVSDDDLFGARATGINLDAEAERRSRLDGFAAALRRLGLAGKRLEGGARDVDGIRRARLVSAS
jgi:hypothetical protein